MKGWFKGLTVPKAKGKSKSNLSKEGGSTPSVPEIEGPPRKEPEVEQAPPEEPGALQDAILEDLLATVRSHAVRSHFCRIQPEKYTNRHQVRVLAGTFNVNGQKPTVDDDLFRDWLLFPPEEWPPRARQSNGDEAVNLGDGPDIVVLGMQEIVALNAGNVLAGAAASADGPNTWDAFIAANLNGTPWDGTSGAKPTPKATPQQSGSEVPNASEPTAATPSEDGGGSGSPAMMAPEPSMAGSTFSEERAASSVMEASPYVQLAAKQMVGLYVSVWGRRALLPHISGLQATAVATGGFGYLGNKGAVAVRMRVFDSDLVVVSSHLASGERPGDDLRRNLDFGEILRRGLFPAERPADLDAAGQGVTRSPGVPVDAHAGVATGHWAGRAKIGEHDNVLWVGDLNYRLTLPDADLRSLLAAEQYDRLLAADELFTHMEKKTAFAGWQEGPICFAPTFKYVKGTSEYCTAPEPEKARAPGAEGGEGAEEGEAVADAVEEEASSSPPPPPEADPTNPFADPAALEAAFSTPAKPSDADSEAPAPASAKKADAKDAKRPAPKKVRKPAYTDRVVWRARDGMYQLAYDRGEWRMSDHKPVFAAMIFEAKQYDRAAVEAAIETARKVRDMKEMMALPKCQLEPNGVELGDVFYRTPTEASVTVFNVGVTPASFLFLHQPAHFFNEPETKPMMIAPDWLSVSPNKGLLSEGESVAISFRVNLRGRPEGTAESVAHLPGKRMDCVLVMRLEGGSDYFIPISGLFRPSCFGLKFQTLLGMERPLQAADSTGAPESSAPNSPSTTFQDCSSTGGLSRSESIPEPGSEVVATQGMVADAASALPELLNEEGVVELLPPELLALTSTLVGAGWLAVPGIFKDSEEQLLAAAGRPMGTKVPLEELPGVVNVRRALDKGANLGSFTSHELAAALMAMFAALPEPFLPEAASQICDMLLPNAAAAAGMLKTRMSAVDWAVLRHILTIMRAVIECPVNGLTAQAVSVVLAELWFPPLVEEQLGDATDEAVLRAAVAEMEASRVRRSQFILMFLDSDAASAIQSLVGSSSKDDS